MLTNEQLDKCITLDQLIGLRFASDEEFVALVDKTIKENISKGEIKGAFQHWLADLQRL